MKITAPSTAGPAGQLTLHLDGRHAAGAPGNPPHWGKGGKEAAGTSLSSRSRVWFTIADGAVTEVFYPRLDCANVRTLKLLVTDGRTFCHDETADMLHHVVMAHPRALAFRVESRPPAGGYTLEKTVITDPCRDALLIRVRLIEDEPGDSRYQVYAYLDTHLNNTGWHDSGATGSYAGHEFVAAWEGLAAMALASNTGFFARNVGYCGSSDGLQSLATHYRLDNVTDLAVDGHVAQLAGVKQQPGGFVLALGFGESVEGAAQTAVASLERPFDDAYDEYCSEWRDYCQSLDQLDGKATELYFASVMVLRAYEDKTFPGAMIASLSTPWGEAADDCNQGGYHLVWARDLYHVAMAFLAAGDRAAANRALDFIARYQRLPDGSVPQNSWLDGRPYWTGLQMDQVADPVILAWRLERHDLYESTVRPMADFILSHGPCTPLERWEENCGFSPASIAAQVAALVCAADMAGHRGDLEGQTEYLAAADQWQAQIEEWCFTTTGPHGGGAYYLRIAPEGRPDKPCDIYVANHGGDHDQRCIVDMGFLELVRLGVKPPSDPYVSESVRVADDLLKCMTPAGPGWYRYNHDAYGEPREGETLNRSGQGRLWVLLTGERGHYELASGRRCDTYLRTIERFAGPGLTLPEQVWERTGKGTDSATPLAWSHAEYICLLKSSVTGKVFDRPEIVHQRYVEGKSGTRGCQPRINANRR